MTCSGKCLPVPGSKVFFYDNKDEEDILRSSHPISQDDITLVVRYGRIFGKR